MKKILVLINCWIIGSLILLSCNTHNKMDSEVIERQRRAIDSLSALTKENYTDESSVKSSKYEQAPSPKKLLSKKKYVIAKLTCKILVPEYKKTENTISDLSDDPLPDVQTQRMGDVLRKQREGNLHEIVYGPQTFICHSNIEEIEHFNEDIKYRFLDKAVTILRMKNENLQKVIKRECLIFDSYSKASEYLEGIETK